MVIPGAFWMPLGYFLVVICWYFLVVSGCALAVSGGLCCLLILLGGVWRFCGEFLAMDCACVVQFDGLVPVGDEQLGH